VNENWDFLTKTMSIIGSYGLTGGELQLEPFRPTSMGGLSPGWDPYRAFELLLHFVAPSGAVEMLQVDTSELTGDFAVTKHEVLAGRDDAVWLSTIPADLFELPDMSVDPASTPVVVKTNGVTGGLATAVEEGVEAARAACLAGRHDESFVHSQFVDAWAAGCMIPLTPSTLSECQSRCAGCPGSCGRCCGGGNCCGRATNACEEACVDVFKQRNETNGTWTKVTSPTYSYKQEFTPVVSITAQVVEVGDTLSLDVGNLFSWDTDGTFALSTVSDADVSIRVGNAACTGITDIGAASWVDSTSQLTITGRSLTCTIGPGAAGTYEVNVVTPLGTADVRPMATITLNAAVSTITPLLGSLAGGIPLSIAGTGLTGLACNSVLVGGEPCTTPSIAQRNTTTCEDCLVCLTPPLASFDPSTDRSTWPGTDQEPVAISGQPVTISGVQVQFAYKSELTAHVASVTPEVRSAATSAATSGG
jgi:hypothetical protein